MTPARTRAFALVLLLLAPPLGCVGTGEDAARTSGGPGNETPEPDASSAPGESAPDAGGAPGTDGPPDGAPAGATPPIAEDAGALPRSRPINSPVTVDPLAEGSAAAMPGPCDLSLSEVAIYQGVKITLARDGVEVAKRSADVIENRPALLRAFVRPGASPAGGEVVVRLTVRSGSVTHTYEARKRVEAAATDDAPTSTFNFDVPPSDLTADARYAVEIVGPTSCQALPAQTRFPSTGEAPLRPRRTGVLKVRIVPVRYDGDGSGRLPDTSGTQLERYRNLLMSMFPVAGVDLSVRQAVNTKIKLTADSGWPDLLEALRGLRAKDGAAADVYYYGLVSPGESPNAYCKGGCIAGISYRAGPSAAQMRVSLGIGFTGIAAAEAMAHELGHAHGRLHAPCGNVKDPDPNFPHESGGIGDWGYDSRPPRQLVAPAAKDIMGYCGPRWISDYTYQALADRSQQVNAPSPSPYLANVIVPGAFRTLLVDGQGRPRWGLPATGLPNGRPVTADVLDWSGAPVDTIDAYETELSDSDERVYLVPEPAPGWHSVHVPGTMPHRFDAPGAVDPLE